MICEEYLRLGTKLRGESLKLKKDERRIAIRNAIEANPLLQIMNFVKSLMLVFRRFA